jgi:hypothetical protein
MKLFIIISTALLFLSCKSSVIEPQPEVENDFIYPFATGSFWYYTSRNFISDIRPDSIRHYFSNDTSVSFGISSFANDTIVQSETFRIFKNEITAGHGAFIKELYRQTDSGLIRYASNTSITGFGPYRAGNQISYNLYGGNFNSIPEIFFYLNEDHLPSDTLIYDNPPKTVLKYPLTLNAQWILFQNNNLKITKTYIDFQNVNLTAGNFYCLRVQKNFYFNNSSTPDNNFVFYDYFSKEGMVKRDFLVKNINVSNSQGQQIGQLDAKEEIFLNLYNLP